MTDKPLMSNYDFKNITQGQKVEKFVISHFLAANMTICKIFRLLGTCINLNLRGCANPGIKHRLVLH